MTTELIEGLMDEDQSLMEVGESKLVVFLSDPVGFVIFLFICAILDARIPIILMVTGAVLCTVAWVKRLFLGRHQINFGLRG